MPAVILIMSAIIPTTGGMMAPPETAMIMSPEISLALSGYSFAVKEKINGKILEADKPIKNIRI
jgi:hypothetical protein